MSQPVGHSVSQLVNQLVCQSFSHSITKSVSRQRSVSQSVGSSFSQPVRRSIVWFVSHSVHPWVIQSVGQSVRPFTGRPSVVCLYLFHVLSVSVSISYSHSVSPLNAPPYVCLSVCLYVSIFALCAVTMQVLCAMQQLAVNRMKSWQLSPPSAQIAGEKRWTELGLIGRRRRRSFPATVGRSRAIIRLTKRVFRSCKD